MGEDLTERSASRPACRIDGSDAMVPVSLMEAEWPKAIHISTYMGIDLATRKYGKFGPAVAVSLIAHLSSVTDSTVRRYIPDLVGRGLVKRKRLRCGSRFANQSPSPLSNLVSCDICGSIEPLIMDHIIPVARGGSNDRGNKQILCHNCNVLKSDSLPSEWRRIEDV